MFWEFCIQPFFLGVELRNWEVSNASNLPKFPRSHHRIEPILEGLSDAESEARRGEKSRRGPGGRFVGSPGRGWCELPYCLMGRNPKPQPPSEWMKPLCKKTSGILYHYQLVFSMCFSRKIWLSPGSKQGLQKNGVKHLQLVLLLWCFYWGTFGDA